MVFSVGLGLGVQGAALATVIGTFVQCFIMLSHFFSKECTLRIVRISFVFKTMGQIITTGLSSSLLDLGNVILVVMMNRKMAAYGRADGLGIYGVVNTIAILCQALFAGIGQTIQPATAVNHGAGDTDKTKEFLILGMKTAICMEIAFTLIGEFFPSCIIRIFMSATPSVLQAAPHIMRLYFLCFPFMGCNILCAYYLQSTLEQKLAGIIAMTRSVILPALCLYILPLCLQGDGVYLSIPVSELLTSLYPMCCIQKYSI